jgi:hypothetical protein
VYLWDIENDSFENLPKLNIDEEEEKSTSDVNKVRFWRIFSLM